MVALKLSDTRIDPMLLGLILTLAITGVIMVGSASVAIGEKLTGDSSYFFTRQAIFFTISLLLGFAAWRIPLATLQSISTPLLFLVLLLLALILVPGIGKTVNGSTRWISLGVVNFQVSEFAKLSLILYISGYIVRQSAALTSTIAGFIRPMVFVMLMALTLIAEPDFGSVVVVIVIAMGMLFLAGARWIAFIASAIAAVGALTLLAFTSPYRMERLTSYLNPWSDPFDSGFQLTQALIAFGRGEWTGVGLGGSVQKLFYLPEAHTDFLYAVIAEELGMVGSVTILVLFIALIDRIFRIGKKALQNDLHFGANLCFGVAIWLSIQTFINMGVNMGLLPTKGLSLPLMSYGGSNLLISFIAFGMVMRVVSEISAKESSR